jgi:hypothetical protein
MPRLFTVLRPWSSLIRPGQAEGGRGDVPASTGRQREGPLVHLLCLLQLALVVLEKTKVVDCIDSGSCAGCEKSFVGEAVEDIVAGGFQKSMQVHVARK